MGDVARLLLVEKGTLMQSKDAVSWAKMNPQVVKDIEEINRQILQAAKGGKTSVSVSDYQSEPAIVKLCLIENGFVVTEQEHKIGFCSGAQGQHLIISWEI